MEFSLNAAAEWRFFKGSFMIKEGGDQEFSYWEPYANMEEDLTIKFPRIPLEISDEFDCLVFDGNEKIFGGYSIISSKRNTRLEELSSPFLIEDIRWRLSNNATEIFQFIKN